MPFVFDDEKKSDRKFVFDDEKAPAASDSSALDTAKNYGSAAVTAVGQGLLGIGTGLSTFAQAPAASALSAVVGGRAMADKGITAFMNWAEPNARHQVEPGWQEDAQQASRFAADTRRENANMGDESAGSWLNPRTALTRMAAGLEDATREDSASIDEWNQKNNPELVRQQKAQADAVGFIDNAKAAFTNPLATVHTLARSAPDMLLGLGAAKLASRSVLAAAVPAAEVAAARVAAAGGDIAAQKLAADAITKSAVEVATARASTAGMIAEPVSSANQGREGVYQEVMRLPIEKLNASSRWQQVLKEAGGDEQRARVLLANELADQTPLLTGAGTLAGSLVTRRLFGGDTSAKAVVGAEKLTLKDVGKNILEESTEEGLQGVPEDLAQFGASSQADPSKKFDLGGTLAQNMVAGALMSGPGTAGRYAYQRAQDLGSGKPAAPAAPGPAPAAPAATSSPVIAAGAAPTAPAAIDAVDLLGRVEPDANAPPPDATPATVKATPGGKTTFTTEAGTRIDADFALVEAGDLVTSHDENLRANPSYPKELQPRDRERAASEAQISGIVQRLDPARLGLSADAANGAPIIGADGLVESGNARTIALKRVYEVPGQKAEDYKQFLRDNAAHFGITPEAIDAMDKPVLVRVRSTPVNRAEFARQANASTVAAMSTTEQARADSNRIDSLEDLNPDDAGEFATSRDFIRRFMGKLPITEQTGMIDANGALSSAGYARVRNAVLAKAYGDSPVLARMVESMDDSSRNITKALLMAAPRVAKARDAIGAGALHDADLTPHLVEAAQEINRLKDAGTSVHDALAQSGMFGESYSAETRSMLSFLAENARRPRRMADFIGAYFDALDAAGDPRQAGMFGDSTAPAKGDLMTAARRETEGPGNGQQADAAGTAADTQRGVDREVAPGGAPTGGQPQDAQGTGVGGEVNGAGGSSEWEQFPAETGTLGIPRAEMPQVKGEHRGALINFLEARGIGHTSDVVPAKSLKPTQAEYSRAKVDKFVESGAVGERSVLVSSDGHVLDGHHQWLGHAERGEDIPVIRLDAPIRKLLDAVNEFPSVKRSEGGSTARDQVRTDFKNALADLAQIASRHTRAAMAPENTPGLMPTLVKLFEAGIKEVGYSMKDLLAYVKTSLKNDPALKTFWNKISSDLYLKAAHQAIDNVENAPAVAMIDGRPYNPKADNFKAPKVAEFMDAGVLERADGYVDKYFKDRPPVALSAEDRAKAEGLLAPMLEKAAADKVAYDQKIIDIAQRTKAIGQMIAPIKGLGRAAEKLALEENFNVDGMKDILRSTIVVSSYADAQEVLTEIEKEFKLLRKPKNRTSEYTLRSMGAELAPEARYGGYSDVLVNIVMPSGMVAEIQINVPQMLAAKEGQGHKLYEAQREAPKESPLGKEIGLAMTEFYDAAFAAAKNPAGSEVTATPPRGSVLAGTSDLPSSDNLNTLPAGNSTNQSPPNVGTNRQPAGNESGSFIGSPDANSVASLPEKGQSVNPGKNQNGTAPDRRGSTQGQGAEAARQPAGVRGAPGVRVGPGQPDLFGGGESDAGAAPGGQVGQRPVDAGGQAEPGPGAQSRGGDARPVGVPAGRDIAAKSGRNYRFGPDDLTYAGSWQKKAAANVDAVELLKALQAEGRQATPQEQQVLAQFIGWGAGELANNLFGKKLDKVAGQAAAYQTAKDYFASGGTRMDRYSRGYYDIIHSATPSGKVRFGEPIEASMVTPALFGLEPADLRWLDLRNRLKAALSAEEWAEASRSTQYAHFTSKAIVESMWRAVDRFGFKGGTMLEPGAGNGVFPGLMPAAISANSSYTGIEFDSITAGILAQLQPDERILHESFVDSKLPKNFFDLAIGNPPFSGTKILGDPEYQKRAFSLHDYFFAKTVDRVKPGGLVMFVTSRYTMDKLDDKARAYLAERADLIGAIRLPQTAFKQNAGTDVVTDVIFLRKKVTGQAFDKAQPWGKSVPMKVGSKAFPVNEYFHAHPEMVLGVPSDTGSMQNSPEPQYTVLATAGDIEAMFDAAVGKMPEGIYTAARGSAAEAARVRDIDFNPKAKKEGNYYLSDAGVLMQREGGIGQRVDRLNAKETELVKAIVPLRDALKQAHFDQLNDGPWEQSLKALQAAYKKFTAVHGAINQSVTKTVKVKVDEVDDNGDLTGRKVPDEEQRRVFPMLNTINDDPDWTMLAALEKVNEETGAVSPGPFLTARVLGKPDAAQISTPHDALLTVLNETGKVDIDAIADRVGLSRDEAIASLGSSIYNDPEGGWTTDDAYLSGNVKRKLDVARAAAKADRTFERNVTALEAAQPAPKAPSQINVGFGMNWIPGSDYAQFLQDTAQVTAKVQYNEATRQWSVQETAGGYNMAATADWGTADRNITSLVESALTGRPIRITRTVGKGTEKTTVFDAPATEAANAKLAALKDEFAAWVWRDPARSDRLVQIYNDKFNTTVPRAFDGRHLTMPGVTQLFPIYDHVKRGAWRIIQSGNTYLAHAVGSGKTFQMVISAMEQKRLGLIKKPMMVVPNHMLAQFAREWQELYPAARLMVADENNFHTDNRRRFVSRVALSDLDGVIITHSAFKLMDIDPAFKAKMIEEQLVFLRASLEQAEDDNTSGRKSPTVKQIEKQIENLEQKMTASLDGTGKDKNVRFDELGVDMLYVDEAHEFRKLDFATSRQVKGIQPAGSARALDLYIKSRYLEEKNPGRSLVMASGTPVTNTLAELYTVGRFLGRQAMIERGVEDFDSWASMFGRERTDLEPNASGAYEPVTRFSKFVNVPELTQMFREYADVLTSDQLADLLGDIRPKVEGGSRTIVVTPKSTAYAEFQKVLEARVKTSRDWKPSKDEPNNPDPIIRIIGDGRLAAIDMRFVDPSLPSDPDSKLNRLADSVIAMFKNTAGVEYMDKAKKNIEPRKGSSMMVFSDLGFGAGVAANRGFNARAWFEKRLRDGGVPADQVAFMSDHKKSTAKLKLFQDVNAGRVRILVGSSKNMGTGVNAQQRLKALFHLDSPWYPADLEQREGRAVRQGNKNKVVELKAFAAKGTYDENMWKMLASKQYFIDQALSGDPNLREIEDLDSQSQFDLAAAMVAEDPRIMQLAGAKAEVEKLNRLYRAHEEQRVGFGQTYRASQMAIAHYESVLPAAVSSADKVKDLSGDKFVAKSGKAQIADRTKWGESIIAKHADLLAQKADSQDIGEISGFVVRFLAMKGAGTYSATVQLMTPEMRTLVYTGQESPIGLAMTATNGVVDVARAPTRLREQIAAARARMDALAPRLETPFPMAEMLAAKIAEVAALEADISKKAEEPAVPDAPTDTPDAALSRGPGVGMDYKALLGVTARVARSMPGLPRVNVLRSTADAPQALQDMMRARGAMADAEGAWHNGQIYLFASGLADEARAEHVLAEHEAAHAGLAGILGAGKANAMRAIANQNPKVNRAAALLMSRDPSILSLHEAVEEVLVDMPSAALARLKGWRALVGKVRDWLKASGMERLAARVDGWLAGHLTDQQRADLFVADLVREARAFVTQRASSGSISKLGSVLSTGKLADDLAEQEKWLTSEAKAQGFASIEDMLEKDYPAFEKLAEAWRVEHPADALLSRAAAAPLTGTPADRAEAIIQTSASTPKPIDAAARLLTRVTGLERATKWMYGKGGQLIDRLTPERIKAGVISDYGVPEAVIDQRAMMTGRQRQAMRGAGALLEKLATLTRTESRIAYEWMNQDGSDPGTYMMLMRGLPEESVQVLQEVQKLIDTLSQEAVRLGQLDAEAFKRNRFAYLRRSYFKYAAELQTGDVAKRQRSISIMGDQYKGRGMTDAAPMRQIQNIAPEWWARKVVADKADTSLKGQSFVRLERREATGAGTVPIEGMDTKQRGKLREIAYYPAGEKLPAKYADWDNAGTWQVVNTKGADAIMWRDFSKDEREKMGEIDEARYAIAKTLHAMIHDVETGRYLEWLAQTQGKLTLPDGVQAVGAGEKTGKDGRTRQDPFATYTAAEWVQIPDTKIQGTTVAKYGKLAGRYVPGPIWNDVRQVSGGGIKIGNETWQRMLSLWKTAKTALSPAVHTNNVMSNMVMADWHDVSAGHVAKALRVIFGAMEANGKGAIGRAGNVATRGGMSDREAAKAIMARYQDSGGAIGGWVTSEIAREQLDPIVKLLEAEINGAAGPSEVGVMSALQHLMHRKFPEAFAALAGSKPGQVVGTEAQNLIDLYGSEDDVFRLAAWLKAKEDGKTDAEAGKVARRSFLDYSINAPWIQAMRSTAFPFISFTYRALPMLLDVAANKPHKLFKLMALAGALNAFGVLVGGGGDDKERKLLPEEKAGGVWGLVPKLVRMPWNDKNGSPVYLDIRRWIPVGDVADLGQGHSALPIPPALMPGGPLAMIGEIVLNKTAFTGQAITLDTDTVMEKAGKIADYLWKALTPNVLGLPGSYATQGIVDAAKGRTDKFGREMSMAQAMANTVGVKLGSYPDDVLRRNLQGKAQGEIMEIEKNVAALKRQYQTHQMTNDEFVAKVKVQKEKEMAVRRKLAEVLN